MVSTVRTRFAPSPTGYLHIGGARTALFSWAYARRHGGQFILRIEDTDVARSTPEAVQAILDGMNWLDLGWDEGPFYQMQRMDRYKAVIQEMLVAGTAYPCYMPPEELDALREAQRARGEKPRYDGRWRPEPGKVLPEPPAGVAPVIRFRNPAEGVVAWDDLVKGRIEIANAEMDDLIIARADGTPTYNFCVCVDDWDMGITQVIRGDDHVNNTPRQINILKALGAPLPVYGHLPMILNEDGHKMSKRRDAVSVVDYEGKGILPEALLNYLARLGWGHGDEEFFNMDQFVEWFSLEAVSPSASRFNQEKFLWLNAQHIKAADNARLAELITPRLTAAGISTAQGPALAEVVALVKERVQELNALARECDYFYQPRQPQQAELDKHILPDTRERMARFAAQLAALPEWNTEAIHGLFKPFCAEEGIKMGQLGMPLRVLVCGTTQTPSVDAVLALIGREQVLARLAG